MELQHRVIYMAKQPPLLLTTTVLTAGASFENPTTSDLLWADGLGRFSGTMVSRELGIHGGHILLSLHFVTLWSLDSVTNGKGMPLAMASKLPISNPIMMPAAMPNTHRFVHDPSFVFLHSQVFTIIRHQHSPFKTFNWVIRHQHNTCLNFIRPRKFFSRKCKYEPAYKKVGFNYIPCKYLIWLWRQRRAWTKVLSWRRRIEAAIQVCNSHLSLLSLLI